MAAAPNTAAGRLPPPPGYEQVLIERGQLGATWNAYFAAQNQTWMSQAMDWRLIMGIVMTVGFLYLVKDLLTISKNPKNVY